jgi:hypothetical protein
MSNIFVIVIRMDSYSEEYDDHHYEDCEEEEEE